jgi:hypothetical protein
MSETTLARSEVQNHFLSAKAGAFDLTWRVGAAGQRAVTLFMSR